MPTNKNNVHVMYSTMLTVGDRKLTPEMQHRIFNHAVSVTDIALLRHLAQYSGLTKEVDDLLAKRTELDVLVAWACRKDRSVAELEKRLLKEKRVSALLPLASTRGLEQRVYETIGRISSVHLCHALADNPSLSDDLRKKKLVEFAKHVPRGAHTQHTNTLVKMVENGTNVPTQTSIYEAIALTSNVAPYLTACLESKVLSTKALDAILSKIEVIYRVCEDGLSQQTSRFFQSLAAYPLNSAQQQVMLTGMETLTASIGTSWRAMHYKEIVERLKNHDSEYETVFASFVSSRDAQEAVLLLESLEHRVKSLGAQSSQASSIVHNEFAKIVRAVAGHDYLPSQAVTRFVSEMGHAEVAAVCSRMEQNGNTNGILDILDATRSPEILLHSLSDEDVVVRAYAARRVASGRDNPSWLSLTGTMLRDHNLAYASLSYEQLLRCMARSQPLQVLVESEMLKLLTSEDAWNVFYVLAKDFNGTLPQLLQASVKLV